MQTPSEVNAITAKLNLATALASLLAALIALGFAIGRVLRVLRRVEDKRRLFHLVLAIGGPVVWILGSVLFGLVRTEIVGLYLILVGTALISVDYVFGLGPAKRSETVTLVVYWSGSILFLMFELFNRTMHLIEGLIRISSQDTNILNKIVHILAH